MLYSGDLIGSTIRKLRTERKKTQDHPLLTCGMNPFVDDDLEKLLTHSGKSPKNVCNLLTSQDDG